MDDSATRVLLVEDNPTDVLIVRELLGEVRALRCEVTTAERLSEALDWIRRQAFDIVLLDLGLSDSEGLASLVHLRRQAAGVPVIALTHLNDEHAALQAARQGAQDYLVKGQLTGPMLAKSIQYAIERNRIDVALRGSEERIAFALSEVKAETRFRSLLDAAPDAIVIVDCRGSIVIVNAQTEVLFGFARAEMIGQAVEMLIPLHLRAHHPSHRAAFFAAPRVRRMGTNLELYGLRKDGTEFPVEVSLSPIQIDDETLVVSAIRDVTERKEMEKSLRAASQMKSAFVANMSHELRTPLNAIIGFTELIHGGLVGPVSPEQQEYLGDVLSSSKHLLQMVNDVLDLAKIEAGRMDVRLEGVNLSELVCETCESLRELVARKGLCIETHVDRELESVLIDAGRVKQILYNYLSNAIKFTPAGGHVQVRANPEGSDMFRLDIIDNGIGISEEDLTRLFAKFQQLDDGVSKRHQGTGLGLALTKLLVETLGGRVSVTSVKGGGSTFSAILPRVMSASEDTE